eukprot:GEMP01043760.1.p1 GENE.GEMP01043760.1~~GEMP01043760.1.p1  ORF type:complete len:414 (+),score=82.98 GEMP01043760.1:31-1242(+)
MVLSAHSDDIEKRLSTVSSRNGRCCYLSHLGLTDCTLPMKALLSLKLSRLDLAFNSLQLLPASIGDVVSLRELWLNDNPHLVSVPVSIANLSNLRLLDLRNTAIGNIPREYAVLNKLNDVDLRGCPLKKSLQSAYARGKDTFFEYLRRKNDRRIYKHKLLQIFHGDIYPFEDVEVTLKPLVDRVFLELKDKTTHELRKLIRHGPRIFPEKAADAVPHRVRKEVEKFVKEDMRTQQTGLLQLKLRGIYPECTIDQAAHRATEIYRMFCDRPKDWKRLLGKEQKLLFPDSFADLSGRGLRDRMEELEAETFAANIIARVSSIYPEATESEKRDLFEYFLDCCEHDWSLLDRNLEKTIPPDLAIVLEKMEDDVQLDFTDKVEEPPAPEQEENMEGAGEEVAEETKA